MPSVFQGLTGTPLANKDNKAPLMIPQQGYLHPRNAQTGGSLTTSRFTTSIPYDDPNPFSCFLSYNLVSVNRKIQ